MVATLLFILSVVCSILSQLPYFVEGGGGGILKVMWILPFAVMSFRKPQDILSRSLLPFFLFVFVFGVYCYVCESFCGAHYVGTDFTNICISTMITVVSYMFWKRYGSVKTIKWVSFSVIVSSLILAYVVNRTYLSTADLMSRVYAYQSKNSTGIILYCAIIFALLLFYNRSKYLNIVTLVVILYLTYMILIIRSRATIAGFAFILYYFIFKSGSIRVKCITVFFSVAAVITVYAMPNLYNIVVDGILFAGRNANDFDDLTSGRTYLISEGIEMFLNNIWFGRGNLYLDCMPLVMLVQYGVFGTSIVFIFLFKIGKMINAACNMNNLSLSAFLLFYSFIINSFFEAQPPFGPGIKCFMLWMTIGFTLAELEEKRLIVTNEKSFYDVNKWLQKVP